MTRIFTVPGDKAFPEADGFSISTKTEGPNVLGGLKIWKIDRTD